MSSVPPPISQSYIDALVSLQKADADQVHAETRGRGDIEGPPGCTCFWELDPDHGFTRLSARPCPLSQEVHFAHWGKLTEAEAARVDALRAFASPRDASDAISGTIQIRPEDMRTRITCNGCGADVTATAGVGHVCARFDFIKGTLGQTPPSGRLFEVVLIPGEARFQVTGLGIGLQLNAEVAIALREAIAHGIRHCTDVHGGQIGGDGGQ